MNSSTATPPPTIASAINGEKLSGQLVIKAQLGDDIRKMMILNEELTLNELLLMLERVFAGKISNSDEITLKYLDDEGDKITLLNDSDLTVALQFHKVLRLFVFVNGQEQTASSSTQESSEKSGNLIDAKVFRTELQQIRNAVQNILDRLQLPAETNQEKEASSSAATSATSTAVNAAPSTTVPSSAIREFDPVKNLSQYQPTQQRSSTPDSIRSKSSTSHFTANNEQKLFQPSSAGQSESTEAQSNATSNYGQPPMSVPQQFVPPSFVNPTNNDQQMKPNAFGPPPTTAYPGIQNTSAPPRYPTAYPTNTSAPPSAFNTTATPPPPPQNSMMPAQTASFIGQQQQQQHQQQQQQQQQPPAAPPQQTPYYGQQAVAPPPTQGGLFQQQAMFQQRPPAPGFNTPNLTGGYAQPNSTPLAPPPSSSSPATITPSSIQPPPMASQQPYGYPPQTSYYGQPAQYPKAS